MVQTGHVPWSFTLAVDTLRREGTRLLLSQPLELAACLAPGSPEARQLAAEKKEAALLAITALLEEDRVDEAWEKWSNTALVYLKAAGAEAPQGRWGRVRCGTLPTLARASEAAPRCRVDMGAASGKARRLHKADRQGAEIVRKLRVAHAARARGDTDLADTKQREATLLFH
ncbi:MAG: hypothetical protein ACKPKO_34545, partial [Candidatus Fonsibacter sp.]